MPADDPRAELARLYDTFAPALYRYALMLLCNHAAAEDAVQHVFAALAGRRPPEFEDPAAYLRAAVRNAAYSAGRATRRGSVQQEALEPILEALPERANAVSVDERLALSAAIRTLPQDQREVLHLHVFEGMTFREIAAVTGDSPNTAASRYRYALQRLRASLTGDRA